MIYLASRSPRRRELLAQIGVRFETVLLREDPRRTIDVDETPLPGEGPQEYVLRVASTKAQVAAEKIAKRRLVLRPVLAADTTVVLDGQILGKPADRDDAARMLTLLSRREHDVMTAVAVAGFGRFRCALSVSKVWFRNLDEPEIRRYVLTGEPADKAGAYAVQGRAAVFIPRIEGSFSGIMGLPLAETATLLREFAIETP